MPRAGTLQDSGTGLDRGPGGQHVIDQQHDLARHRLDPARMDPERFPDVAPAFPARKSGLRSGPAATQQQIGRELGRMLCRDASRQQKGLIVAPGEETPPMERHRRHEIGLGD